MISNGLTTRLRGVRPLLVVAGLALAVSGCSSLRSMVGLDKDPPDEFQVVNRAPLSMPPDYGLRAPQPGASRPQETSSTDQARQIVIDRQAGASSVQPVDGRSASESALLKKAGALNVNPGIRGEIDTDASMLADADKRWIDSLLFWRKAQPDNSAVVDAEKESARLRENAALNKPANSGETPTIKKKSSGSFF
jgi:Protein of unknown function (DUF3035)